MAKFLLLFRGGIIPQDKKEQSIKDRLEWMNNLRSSGNFIDGSPLLPTGKIIDKNTADFVHENDSINGYAIINTENINEAEQLSKPAPQLRPEYGSA